MIPLNNMKSLPSFSVLILLLPFISLLHKIGLSSASTIVVTILTLFLISIKVRSFIVNRRQLFKTFDNGNVPALDNTNLFSGNMFNLLGSAKSIEIIHQYHEKLGKIYGAFYGPDPWVFCTDLDLIHRLFVSEGHKYVDITEFRMPFVTEFNTSIGAVHGDEWRRARRILNPPFTQKQMRSDNVFKDIERVSSEFLSCIDGHPIERVGSDGKSGEEKSCRIVDVNYNFKKFAINVIFRVAYGCDQGVNMKPMMRDKLLDTIHDASCQVRSLISYSGIMFHQMQHFLGLFVNFTSMGRCLNYIHSVLDESIKKRRLLSKNLVDGDRRMIDTIIDSIDSNKMSTDNLKANLFFIFIAGFETTANTLAIMFWLLARHTKVQDKLRAAVAVDGEKAAYLDWCLKETLRLYPAVPAAIGRILPETIQFKDMTFYKGTTINASIYSIHRSAEYWGADVDEFRPERFEDSHNHHPMQYFAFAHGPRYCLGKNLAEAEIKSIVPRILLRYNIERCPDTSDKLNYSSENLIHMILHGKLELKFIEISSI